MKNNKLKQIDNSLKIRKRKNHKDTVWKVILNSITSVECRKVYDIEKNGYTDRIKLVFGNHELYHKDDNYFEIEFNKNILSNLFDCISGRLSMDYDDLLTEKANYDASKSVKIKKSRYKRK